MTIPLGNFRQSGSFIAGVLIGLSIVVATFAATDVGSPAWQIVLILGAPIILTLGLALQVLVTARRRRPPAPYVEREVIVYGLATMIDARA